MTPLFLVRKNSVMRLADYLKEEGLTLKAFATRVPTTEATVSRIAARKLWPSLQMAARIEDASGGKVTMRELLKDLAAAQSEREEAV